jgi:sodium/potassium-transporting ATPase subunit alpha
MSVTDIFAGGEEYTPQAALAFLSSLKSTCSLHVAIDEGHSPDAINSAGVTNVDSSADVLNQIRLLSALCNAGEFDAATINMSIKDRKINGDATDQALLRLSESFGEVQQVRREWRKVAEVGFNSRNKFMVRIMKKVGEAEDKDA